ncbi:MAG TPA: homoserine dehydrogenase [Armatimonadota bacterium]|nr:homoserine dehydrogenase [Armatimonadota bacterium]
MSREQINVGVIGFGTVGVGAVQLLETNADWIAQRVGSRVVVKRVMDVDWSRPRAYPVRPEQQATAVQDILDDPEIDIVIEAVGGVTHAKDAVVGALTRRKSVVTPNKELIAKHGAELLNLAAEAKVDLMFEGAVGGGIPIIRPLKESLAGDRILRLVGIVNGTTNFILTAMSQEGRDFADVLKDAQAHGYAEADPTADVEGFDAMYKIAILSSIAYGGHIDVQTIYHEGITKITAADIEYAHQLGFEIKLLAIGARAGQALDLRVHPAFVPMEHPLASVHGVFNAIFVQGDPVGDLMFYGRGAGAGPTGSAVVGDVIDCARNINHGAAGRVPCRCYQTLPIQPISEVVTGYYIRTCVQDRPGVVGKMATIFGDHGVSLTSVFQPQQAEEETGAAEVVWITHRVQEAKLQAALKEIATLDVVEAIASVIRVEG